MATKPTFDPRRGEPGATYVHAHPDGTEHSIGADDEGILRPATEDDERLLKEVFGLPVARAAIDKKAGAAGDKEE